MPVSAHTCTNHPERKAHRRQLCKSCYERDLKAKNPEYAAREAEKKRARRASAKAADPEGFARKAAAATARHREKHPERLKTPWETDPAKARAAIDKYRAKNVEVVRERSREWYRDNPEAAREYRAANVAVIALRTRKWRAANPERVRFHVAAYRAAKINAQPAWADEGAIAAVYAEAAKAGLEVDHAIPLRGKLVCGLHVASNLQLLSRRENAQKGNSYAG